MTKLDTANLYLAISNLGGRGFLGRPARFVQASLLFACYITKPRYADTPQSHESHCGSGVKVEGK
jgi:hypothetical protein